jgi:hypothetical protein
MKNNISQNAVSIPRFRIIIIMLGMLVVIAATVAIALFLIPFSGEIASQESYAYIAFMRYPVLVICESILLLFLIACLLSVPLLIRIYQGKPFTRMSVRLLRYMTFCFYLMILPLAALVIYTRQHVGGSITNLYCFLGMGLAILAGTLFGLFATLIEKASEFEQEVNLTI